MSEYITGNRQPGGYMDVPYILPIPPTGLTQPQPARGLTIEQHVGEALVTVEVDEYRRFVRVVSVRMPSKQFLSQSPRQIAHHDVECFYFEE